MLSFNPVKHFAPAVEQIRAEWQGHTVITNAHAFEPIPAARLYRMGSNLPPLRSNNNSELEWMQDTKGRVVVTKKEKKSGPISGWRGIVGREKMASDFGLHLQLPMLPTMLWEVKTNSRTIYYSVTPKAFTESRTGPSDAMLLADESLAQISVFNQWIMNTDQHRRQIVYDGVPVAERVNKIFLDFSLSNYGDPKEALPLLPETNRYFLGWDYIPIGESVKQRSREHITSSPVVAGTIAGIEKMSDQFIRNTVNRLPDAVCDVPEGMNADRQKQVMIDRLMYRRDNLRGLLRKGYEIDC